jgi:hypothetical protein
MLEFVIDKKMSDMTSLRWLEKLTATMSEKNLLWILLRLSECEMTPNLLKVFRLHERNQRFIGHFSSTDLSEDNLIVRCAQSDTEKFIVAMIGYALMCG